MESRFRYLGQQRTDGHSTFVVGFAQIPGSVVSPGAILTDRESLPMLLQGITWIDQADFRIVRLRTDLLAPQPEISLERQTAYILFGPVHIATLDSRCGCLNRYASKWRPRASCFKSDIVFQVPVVSGKKQNHRVPPLIEPGKLAKLQIQQALPAEVMIKTMVGVTSP